MKDYVQHDTSSHVVAVVDGSDSDPAGDSGCLAPGHHIPNNSTYRVTNQLLELIFIHPTSVELVEVCIYDKSLESVYGRRQEKL